MGRQISEHFNEDELRCRCGCGRMEFSDQSVSTLEELRQRVNRPMRITSGYRCPKYNDEVSGTGLTGPHTVTAHYNITVDVKVSGEAAVDLLHEALRLGFTGIGVKQSGPHDRRFIHLDLILSGGSHPRPWVWSY